MHDVYPDTPLVEGRIVRIVDGDTLVVDIDSRNFKVRLVGLNAPESVAADQERNCEEGAIASSYLKKITSVGQAVWLQRDVSETDEYGRLLRYIWLEHTNKPDSILEIQQKMLNALLIRNGYAQARKYEPDTTLWKLFYALGKEAAQSAKGVSYLWVK